MIGYHIVSIESRSFSASRSLASMSRNDSGFYGVVYDEDKDRFESYMVLYDSEKKRLPPSLSSRGALSGGYYKREEDAAKASDM